MKIAGLIVIIIVSNMWQQTQVTSSRNVPRTLKGTNWTSDFYHYHNNYYFDSDSSGFSEVGQMASSCPIDTLALGISGNEIIYTNPEKFRYNIADTVLTMEYLTWKSNDTIQYRVFYYRSEYDDWISEYEYTYGKECLRQRERIEKLDWE